jgi:hypothetical protein
MARNTAFPNLHRVLSARTLPKAHFAPGRQIFSGDRSHPVLHLSLQISDHAKCRNDMKGANFIQKRLLMSLLVRCGGCPYCDAQRVFLSVKILRGASLKISF